MAWAVPAPTRAGSALLSCCAWPRPRRPRAAHRRCRCRCRRPTAFACFRWAWAALGGGRGGAGSCAGGTNTWGSSALAPTPAPAPAARVLPKIITLQCFVPCFLTDVFRSCAAPPPPHPRPRPPPQLHPAGYLSCQPGASRGPPSHLCPACAPQEYLVQDLAELLLWTARARPALLAEAARRMEEAMVFLTVFLGSSAYVRNPYVRWV
jgi:hypothetical protein